MGPMVMPVLAVRDLELSLPFYRDQLGFQVPMVLPDAAGVPNFAVAQWGEAVSFGLSAAETDGPKGTGVVFMVYVPEGTEIDAYYAEVQERGVAITKEIADMYWGDRSFTVIDPDGYVLEFCQTTTQMTYDEIAATSSPN